MIEYSELIQKFHRYFLQDGNACVSLGINEKLDDLPDPSIEAITQRITEGQILLGELLSFPRGVLAFDEMLDLDLAILTVEFEVYQHTYTFNEKNQWQQKPTAGDDISNGLFLMFINDPRPAYQRLDNMTARLEKVPQYLNQLLKRLDNPVRRWVTMDLEKIAGLPELFTTIYNWGQEEGYPQLKRLETAKERAEVALQNYSLALKQMPTTDHIFIGKKQATKLIKLRGIDLSLEELHKMANAFLTKTQAEIEELRLKLIHKYQLASSSSVEDVQAFLNQKYQIKLDHTGTMADVITRYARERDTILNYLQEKELFPIFTEQEMVIIQTPTFMTPSIPAGAMVSPPPFRDGVKKSIVYLTLSEELLDEHTELSIPSMMIHEGIPGHHLQLATACNHPSLVRRHCNAMEHAEGWTTMLEDYMLDIGYLGELKDEARFIAKRDICRIGARVAIDLYFMTGDKKYLSVGVEVDVSSTDPFVNAGRLLQKVTGFVSARIEAELNWYSQERGYPLSYLTGNQLVWDLKKELIQKQKGKLEGIALDRIFHKIYLESGNMPLTFLRRVFEHYQLI